MHLKFSQNQEQVRKGASVARPRWSKQVSMLGSGGVAPFLTCSCCVRASNVQTY